LSGVKRRDYLPFGEELVGGTAQNPGPGGRLTDHGYAQGDDVRQQFTSKERDTETGLNYFLARYYSSAQGRFTSPDEFIGGPYELYDFVDAASENPTFYADFQNPQSLNKYQYVYNNPLGYIDPEGHAPNDKPPTAYVDDVEAEKRLQQWRDARAEAHHGLGKFQKGGSPNRRLNEGNRGNPKSDPRNWENRRGRQVYVGPGSWTYGTGRPRTPRYPTFRNLKDHAKRHSELRPREYYEQARLHMTVHQWKFKFRHDGQSKVAYVTQLGPDWFMFTSTTPSRNRIFTHMPVNQQYLRNIGITLPQRK
jgi:RHS repeat-associated protein